MSKRVLLRLATSICFMLCIMVLGQITVFAEDSKPLHEYKFDGESDITVIDTGTQRQIGTSYGENCDKFYTGYNGIGRSRFFNGNDDYIALGNYYLHAGAKSIRFKFKKETSPASNKIEHIIRTSGDNYNYGYFIGIGSDILNQTIGNYGFLPKTGSLYIAHVTGERQMNFELQTPENVCDGQWHDVLFTWDGTMEVNSIKLYLDDMQTPVAQTTPKYNPERSGVPATIGKGYHGYLDDIQIYNTVITPETPTPVTPLNLNATAGNSKIDLTWDAVEKATSYTIKRSTTAGGPYTAIATDITDISYTDTDVKNGTTYYYIVSAINAGAEIGNSNEAYAQPTESQTPPITDSKLKVVLEVSEALRLSVDNDLNVNTQMSWSSSDPTVATVNEKGIVTALAPGNTVITVKSVDGSYTDYINVLVVENADDYRLAIDLKIGETARLTADDFTNTANITWAPMDSSIANVTSKGKVTALSKGLVLISAKDADGNIIGRVYVRVRE